MNLEILSTPELEQMWKTARDPRFPRKLQEEIESRQLRVTDTTPSLFPKAPSTKLQAPEKHQAPNPNAVLLAILSTFYFLLSTSGGAA